MNLEFIAEVGINHNGSLEIAKRYCDLAKECGASTVKFQTFNTDDILKKDTPLAEYQIKNTSYESQNVMLKKSELNHNQFYELKRYCEQININFLTTAYDFKDIKFISQDLRCKRVKLASISIIESSILNFALEKFDEVIISTGFTDQNELIRISNSTKEYHNKLIVMHCTSSYPCNLEEANINSINNLYKLFPKSRIGFSDHTLDTVAANAAVSLGAKIFEKHITFDKKNPGPDHIMSMEPEKFKEYISDIKKTYIALGSKIRLRTPSEKNNIQNMRRSLFARVDIKKGQKINYLDLILLRPDLYNNQFQNPVGKIAIKDIKAGDPIYPKNYE